MIEKNTAYFVYHPWRVADLKGPHFADREQTFTIVKTVLLSKIEYENFSEDLLADRQFIEDYGPACAGQPNACLYVKQKGKADGILVRPERKYFVGHAAYWCEKR